MLFNSFQFSIFLPIVFLLYWILAKRKLQYQNVLLLIASYFFYACWDYRFLFLLIFSTLLDYYSGLKISNAISKQTKRIWLLISVIINLGFLGLFKYYNFFIASLTEAMAQIGLHLDWVTMKVILPVGISFYTFHGLSYVFDIYNNKIKPEKNFIVYSVFVSFFPLLVAGPIERATHLLPQIKKERTLNYIKAIDGLRQILWGLFKKVVIADSCAVYANSIFNNYHSFNGSTIFLGAVFFTVQIYCDFSGYSDIALGTARLFGIDLLRNFAFPFFSRDIAEFWRRWHISLSSWFKDYLYIPLGGSKGNTLMKVRNTFIIFLVSGFWHGANWTFIVWGLLNALYIMPSIVFNTNRNNIDIVAKGHLLPSIKDTVNMVCTFLLTVFAFIFFRASDMQVAVGMIAKLFSTSLIEKPHYIDNGFSFITISLLCIFIVIEWLGRENEFAIQTMGLKWKMPLRWGFYYALILAIFLYAGGQQQFIYFQF